MKPTKRDAWVWLGGALVGCVVTLAVGLALRHEPAASTDPKPDPQAGDEHQEKDEKDEHEHEALPTRVRLSDGVLAAAGVRVAPVGKESLAATLGLQGEIAADPDRMASISSLVAGRLERVDLREGGAVRKGELVALVRIPEIGKLRGELQATSGKATAARAKALRVAALVAKGLAAEQEALDAASEADALETEARALAAELRALDASGSEPFLPLRSPLDGVVIARDAVVGAPVTAEQTLATIADLGEVWFLARVFERDLGRLVVGAAAEVALNAYPDEHFAGKVEYLSRKVDPAARTVVARVRLTNRGDMLRLGLFGTARVGTGEGAAQTLVVPRSALTEIAGKSVVFVREADGDFEVHEIVLGDAALGRVSVLNGLDEGEEVVVDGVFALKSAVLKSTFAEEEE
ncbi:MAG: efflux RND transporter periplasmic adaptor subunit [Polyangiaceae bacterium]|nr:efflux RND transporter periplasmic adaptor subunit [Polyangiaceae bacterium]